MSLPSEILDDPALAPLKAGDFDPTSMTPEARAAIVALRQKFAAETERLTKYIMFVPIGYVIEQLAWGFFASAGFEEALAKKRINAFIDECLDAIDAIPRPDTPPT